jgi:hypothetical protein
MTRLSHGVQGANQHAVRVPVENVSVVVPACNVDLDQPGQYAAYFEFGITRQSTATGRLQHQAVTCAFHRFTKNWHIEIRTAVGGEWVLAEEYNDTPEVWLSGSTSSTSHR